MRILHLSDLHFGIIPARRAVRGRPAQQKQSAHYFIDSARQPDPTILPGIFRHDLAEEPPDVIVVSGDIGWSGTADDYAVVPRFFDLLRAAWPSAHVVIAPGNHDLTWNSAVADSDRQVAFVDMLKTVYSKDFRRRFPLFAGKKRGQPTRHQLVGILHVPDQLLVVAANSAASLTTGSTPIHVEPVVLGQIRDYIIAQRVSPKALRVFVLHHHLLPFAEPNWGIVQDASTVSERPDDTIVANTVRLQGWLAENSFRVLLHGHKHLSHGREDVLWRHGDPLEGRRLLIVGAGSAGVTDSQRGHDEPLSYNVIDVRRLSDSRWDVRVSVRRVSDAQAVPTAVALYEYRSQVGPPIPRVPVVFTAERMDDCHAAIAASVAPGVKLRNFVSVVESYDYAHPPTIRIGVEVPSPDDVRRSFRALHPEYHEQSGWSVLAQVDERLQNVPARFQFQHGTRLFGTLGRAGTRFRGVPDRDGLRPLVHAVGTLRGSESRAYVGLYNAEIDIASEIEPIPGLMSVQFVPDGDYLDVVATFRKLELSFWWVVNMFELGELLKWASKRTQPRRTPRSITFFAPIAEWKRDPEATFITALDGESLSELYDLVARADSGSSEACDKMASLLRDKLRRTNEVNLDDTGIQILAQLVDGVLRSRRAAAPASGTSPITAGLLDALNAATREIGIAITDRSRRDHSLEEGRRYLQVAADLLAQQRTV